MKHTAILSLAALFTSAATAAPETFVIDGSHTLPRFSYSHFGYSTQLSRFNKTSGKIVLDRQAQTGSVDVTVDTGSVDTGYSLFDEQIQGEDFLDTANYRTMTFISKNLKFEGENLVSVDGTLTLKGISKPVR
nr:YceI family protein [Methylomarinum sp. Ch1-1]MDP4520222.1 YceI family protein [Methylomarinum sp. Ch1-1]